MLLGQDEAIAAFRAARASGRLHHALLLAGPEGVGKRLFAEHAAAALLAGTDWETPADHPAARLLAAGSHPDHRLLAPPAAGRGAATGAIAIDQVRALRAFLHGTPALGAARTVVIDPVDALNPHAANALLKELEEPRAGTTFLLVAHAPGRLLPTLRSRCRLLPFRRLGAADMRRVLARLLPDLGEAEAELLVRLSDGSPGVALSLHGHGLLDLMQQLEKARCETDLLSVARALQGRTEGPAFAAFCRLVPERIAALARASLVPALADLYAEAEAIAASAVALAMDRALVALALGRRLLAARHLAVRTPGAAA